FGDDGDGEFGDGFHLRADERGHLVGLFRGDVEEELVVDLEGHAGAEIAAADLGVDADHGEFDEVGGGALQRCVDGGAFGKAALVGIAGVDVRDGADAAERGAHGLRAASLVKGGFDEGGDAFVAVEVFVDVVAGGALVDGELRGEAEGRDAVDNAEVDGLGAGAGLFAHGGGVDFEDLGGGEGVDVFASAVGVEEERVLREVRHEAELDLRVVGGHEEVAGRGDEGGANLAADGGADGDVLQVGVGGREAAGGGADLVEGGVDALIGVGERGQRVEVGAFELGELAVLEDVADDGIVGREVFEDVLRGGDDFALAVLERLG